MYKKQAKLVIILTILFILLYNFFLKEKTIYDYKVPNILYFCGKKLDIEKYPFLKEKFEIEFYGILDNKMQIILNIRRSNKYFPYIEKQLKLNNLCDDLKYLAVVESALRENATSSANAKGIWQFIESTATKYGLIINENIDERLNFEKSTNAAINYLKDLLNLFNNDPLLAIAAYNMGENGLKEIIKIQQETDFFKLNLNNETSKYVIKAFITKEIFENQNKYNIKIKEKYKWPKNIETINVNQIDNLIQWCKENNQDYKTIKELNPWIISRKIPQGNWQLKILKK